MTRTYDAQFDGYSTARIWLSRWLIRRQSPIVLFLIRFPEKQNDAIPIYLTLYRRLDKHRIAQHTVPPATQQVHNVKHHRRCEHLNRHCVSHWSCYRRTTTTKIEKINWNHIYNRTFLLFVFLLLSSLCSLRSRRRRRHHRWCCCCSLLSLGLLRRCVVDSHSVFPRSFIFRHTSVCGKSCWLHGARKIVTHTIERTNGCVCGRCTRAKWKEHKHTVSIEKHDGKWSWTPAILGCAMDSVSYRNRCETFLRIEFDQIIVVSATND